MLADRCKAVSAAVEGYARIVLLLLAAAAAIYLFNRPFGQAVASSAEIGHERAIARHLQDGEEYEVSIEALLTHGQNLLGATWTVQDGAGRPLTKGTGAPLSDPAQPLVFPRGRNRVSAPDADSCAGCHNSPFGIVGGGGDFVTNVFVTAQRFDFATFDSADATTGVGSVDETGNHVTLQNIGNSRSTLGMFGSGYIEMLARQMTGDLQAIRDGLGPGESQSLTSKGVGFGELARDENGRWITSGVAGLPERSLLTGGPDDPPSLVVRPFHQVGEVVSLREFSNNAFNHHHGIQTTERFGQGTDPDGDGVIDEMTRADVTAASLYQATLPVPGRVIPRDAVIEAAVWDGEQLFSRIGCGNCHIPALPLDREGWIFVEPNPYNPAGNLQPGDAPALTLDLTDRALPQPRLLPQDGVLWVPAFTDLKLHDITSGPDDPNAEPLNQAHTPDDHAFFEGNRRFLTRKLWGVANEPPYFHHGHFTTLRESVLAHSGEALVSRLAFEALSPYEQDSLIEFLKSLQVLAPGTHHRIVDEEGRPRPWPPTP